MGSHAKPRTTGRKTALSALALGATLTGVGLTAAALDPATAVFTATGTDEGGAVQLSGLSTPVSLDLSPAADSITDLSSAPLAPVGPTPGPLGGSSAGTAGGLGGVSVPVGLGDRSVTAPGTSASAGTGTTTGRQNSIKPIVASTPGTSFTAPSGGSGSSGSSGSGTTGSGSTGSGSTGPGSTSSGSTGSSTGSTGTSTSTQPRSAAPPAADSALASTASGVLPTVAGLVSKVPVVSSVVQDTGLLGTNATQSSTSSASSPDPAADPVSTATGVVGGLPVVGTLLDGLL